MRHRLIAAGASLGLAVMSTQLVAPGAHAVQPAERAAAAPIIKAKMTHSSIKLSDDTVRAGRIEFKVVTHKGGHVFQLLRIHSGYTPQQLSQDIPAAFSGDTAAIARVDDNVTWLGGAEAHPGRPGFYEVKLRAGHYLAVDQEGNGLAMLTVKGTVHKRVAPQTQGTIATFTYGFRTDGKIRANGWVKARNRADQPHFIVLQHVKKGTTRQQVVKFFKSGGQGRPSWALRGSTSLGVISPTVRVDWHLDLPTGRYALFCFWPDRMTGMPHVAMGMIDMVNLR